MTRPILFNLPFSKRFIRFYHALNDAPPCWADIILYHRFAQLEGLL